MIFCFVEYITFFVFNKECYKQNLSSLRCLFSDEMMELLLGSMTRSRFILKMESNIPLMDN